MVGARFSASFLRLPDVEFRVSLQLGEKRRLALPSILPFVFLLVCVRSVCTSRTSWSEGGPVSVSSSLSAFLSVSSSPIPLLD